MLNQTKYTSITIIQSSFTEQSVMVDCPDREDKTAIVQSYSTDLADKILADYTSQIDQLSSLSHPNIQSVIEIFVEGNNLHLVTGAVQGKPAAATVLLSEERCEKLLKDILPVLTYLHEQGIVHGNISPETILFKAQNQPILTNFKAVTELKIAAGGEVAQPISQQLTSLSIGNIPNGKQFDLYSLGVTIIYLLSNRELKYLYDVELQQWKWDKRTNTNASLTTAINLLISSNLITAKEVLATLESSTKVVEAQTFMPSIENDRDLNVDLGSSTFIELPNNINDPVYMQSGIIGFLIGSIWILTHNLLSWGSIQAGIFGMIVGGAIYWQYRSPFKINQLAVITGSLFLLIILIPPLRQNLPIFKIESPGVFDIIAFSIACGLFNFSVCILAGFIYRILAKSIDNN